MKKGWREWLLAELAGRGISQWALKTEYHFSPQTLDNWEKGQPARAGTVRKLAGILGIPYARLLDRLGVDLAIAAPPGRKA